MLKSLAKLTEKVLGPDDHHHSGSSAGTFSHHQHVPMPSEAQVYKNLLIDMQYNQLLVSREYQALFNEQTNEIKRLKALLPSSTTTTTTDEGTTNDVATTATATTLTSSDSPPNKKPQQQQQQPPRPLREMSPEDVRVVIREWERKLKANIVAKTEALAEAAMHRETVEALVKQLDELRSHVRKQDEALKRQGTVQSALDRSRVDHQAAMEQLMIEFNKVSTENEEAKYKASQMELEIGALRRKADSDGKAIEILKQTPTEGDNQAHVLTLKRYEQNAEADRVRIEELEAALRRAEGDTARVAQLDSALQGVTREYSVSIGQKEQIELSLRQRTEEFEEEKRIMSEAHVLEMERAVTDERQRAKAEMEGEVRKRAQLVDEIQALTTARDAQVAETEHVKAVLGKVQEELNVATKAQQELNTMMARVTMLEEQKSTAEALHATLNTEIVKLKARIQELETELAAMKTTLMDKQNELQLVGKEVTTLTASLTKKTEELRASEAAVGETQQELLAMKQLVEASKQTITTIEASMASLEMSKQQTIQDMETAHGKALQDAIRAETTASEQRVTELTEKHKTQLEVIKAQGVETVNKIQAESKMALDKADTMIAGLQSELQTFATKAEEKLRVEVDRVTRLGEENKARAIAVLETRHGEEIAQARKVTEEFRDMYAKETLKRRQAHNELMDLKGNIRVFARARPVLPNEAKLDGTQRAEILDFPSESGGKDLIVKREDGKIRFEFDAAMGPTTTQQQVFDEVAPFIISVMDGVNVTLFAYGQTGSGKTFTMNGDDDRNPGVNTRALDRVFALKKERAKEAEYWFEVSVLEVYLETVRDLLAPAASGGGGGGEGLDIRLHPDTKQVYVPGLTRTRVNNVQEIHVLNKEAWKNRAVGSHNMNEHSSRSHMVFTLTVHGKSLLPGPSMGNLFEGNLNLIDLAGSERLSKTDASGDRLKEAQAINKSLSALADVISALGERGKTGGHIPYRNTKLTFLLQDQLGGSAKVGFFANLSPVEWNASETLSTLRFAERCRKTELGKAGKNVVPGDGGAAEIARLKKVIDDLRTNNSKSPVKNNNGNAGEDPLTSSAVSDASASPTKPGVTAPSSSVKRNFEG